MAATNDKAMCRLLFAMLKQKCLKDIDWNKVAADPVLIQPITNGHAARMRFSRFKTSMDPEAKLHKSTDNTSRVAKPKKEKGSASARGKPGYKSDLQQGAGQDTALEEATMSSKGYHTTSPFAAVKLESPSFPSLPTPNISAMGGMFPDSQVRFHNRLMTPSSDLMGSPGSEFLNAEAFDLSPTADTRCSPEQQSWHESPTYPTFGMPHGTEVMSRNFGEQPHVHHYHQEMDTSSTMMESRMVQNGLHQEGWDDSQYHTI